MIDPPKTEDAVDPDIIAYKTLLRQILDRRPSGTRLKLADALGKNRSFISQISNPTYKVPIPARHLDRMFEVCRFSPAERDRFMEAYRRAHPGRATGSEDAPYRRELTMTMPDLGDEEKNRQLDALVRDFAHRVANLVRTE